jgi:tetratricopeptide (TPR) repeat protein
MALRLVKPADGPAPAASSTPEPALAADSPIAALGARAGELLAAHDVRGYAELLEATAQREHVHGRYVARRILLERLLGAPGLPGHVLAEAYLAAARVTVDILHEEPREPVLLNTCGILLYELGAIAAAESLFRAAERLDAELPHLAGNLEECRRRRRDGGASLAGMPPAVLRELRTLGPKAQKVAVRAVPATGLTISLCMIVKDEEAMLPRCLAAVRDAVDEIVIVDTGSTDKTVEIAESFGAKILHHEWTGDFAVARNDSFDAATGDWLLYLDADEVLYEDDAAALRELTGKVWREAMFLVETNHVGDLEDGTSVNNDALRIFRNRPEYRFEGRIHEQIAQRLPDIPERLERTSVRIEHFGYLGAVRDAKAKSRRNIELLERQAAEGHDSPFLHFNLGSEYGAANEPQRALEHFRTAWDQLESDPQRTRYGFFPSLCARLVKAQRCCDRHDEAIATGDRVLELLAGFTDVVFEQGWAHRGKGDLAAALASFERCVEMGDAPSRYSAAVGMGSFLAQTAIADLHIARGDHQLAAAVLRDCLREHPRFIGAIEPFAQTLLRLGVPAADVSAEVAELAPDLAPGARFLLAVPLYEAGAVVEAEVELRAVLAAQPSAHAARVALAEAVLSQGRLAEAASIALEVPVDAPWAPAAAGTASFASIAAGLDAEPALAYAQAAGISHAEITALRAWVAGEAADASVPASAAPLVATMLEALARLEDFDGFERLAGIAEELALPWRERRELMAQVYLRRGFLESAADEWITVVERDGPDQRALGGLSRVAALRGFDEDAELLRREADALVSAP